MATSHIKSFSVRNAKKLPTLLLVELTEKEKNDYGIVKGQKMAQQWIFAAPSNQPRLYFSWTRNGFCHIPFFRNPSSCKRGSQKGQWIINTIFVQYIDICML